MKFGIVLSLLMISANEVVADPTTVFHSVTSGGTAIQAWSDELGDQSLTVLTRDAASGQDQHQATINYEGWAFDPTSEVCTTDPILDTYCHYTRFTSDVGYGDIPRDDVKIGAMTAKVATDITANLNYSISKCISDEVAGTVICKPGVPNGIVNLEWRRTSGRSFRNFGLTEIKTLNWTTKYSGNRTEFSANVQGTAFGMAVQNAGATIGTGTNVVVDVIRNQ